MVGNAFKLEIEVAVTLARKAAFATEAIRKDGIESMSKGDIVMFRLAEVAVAQRLFETIVGCFERIAVPPLIANGRMLA